MTTDNQEGQNPRNAESDGRPLRWLYLNDPKLWSQCNFGDPTCPCQDGDMCHYEGTDAWPSPLSWDEYTPSVVRLAIAIAQSLRNDSVPLYEQATWYADDADAVASHVPEGDGWVVHHDPYCLGEYFTVNGTEFWLDMNAEGLCPPVLAAEHRAELAAEEADEAENW